MIFTLILLIILSYIFYTRFFVPWTTLWFYKKQGVKIHNGAFTPFVGSYASIMAFDTSVEGNLTSSPHPMLGWN